MRQIEFVIIKIGEIRPPKFMMGVFNKAINSGSEIDDDEEHGDEDDMDFDDEDESFTANVIVSTPLGPLPYHESYVNFLEGQWFVGHTNFRITNNELKELGSIDGMEYIKQLSPYRILICIGLLFELGKISDDINKILKIEDIEEPVLGNTDVEKEISNKMKDKDIWLGYIFPNGRYFTQTYLSNEDRDKGLEAMKELRLSSNGKIVGKLK
jgi:hypothetical protein